NEPVVEYVNRDDDYIKEMAVRAAAFMLCVQTRTPPVTLDPVAPPTNGAKVYDMTGNNYWASNATMWMANRAGHSLDKHAESELKRQVPDDAKKCHGHGVQ